MNNHITMRLNHYDRFACCSLLFISLSMFSCFLFYDINRENLYLCNDEKMIEKLMLKPMNTYQSLKCINQYSLYNENTPRYNFLMYDNDITKYVYIVMVVLIGLMYGIFIVSIFVYNPYVELVMKNEKEEEDDYNNYLKQNYPYEYRYTFNKEVYEKHMKEQREKNEKIEEEGEESDSNNYICDTTPDGLVFMTYNRDREGFEYWSNKNVHYIYLESLARKYVKTFSCYHLYVSDPIFESDEETEEEIESETEEDEKEGERDEVEEEEEKENKENDDDIFLKKRETTQEKREVKNKNKYIHRGPITEFNLLNVKDYTGNKNKLSFADFKKLFKMS